MNELLGLIGLVLVPGWPFAVLVLFAVLSVVAIVVASRLGRGRPWGRWTALAIFLFVFWDTPLVLGTFHYQCATKAGFTVNKPLEEWVDENPGVAETLMPLEGSEYHVETKNGFRGKINNRFTWVMKKEPLWLGVQRRTKLLGDSKTGEVLAREVDFFSMPTGSPTDPLRSRTYKFWLTVDSCPVEGVREKWLVDGESFSSFVKKVEIIKEDFE